MPITFRQNLRIAVYIAQQRLKGHEKFPLVLQLEPLYRCNLTCAGCGKIQHPQHILAQRLSVQQCIDAVEECGAPIVSIAGGEPLIHREIDQIVAALLERKRFVYLCTNAILMSKKLDQFRPSPYFSWSIHIDGLRERHDQSVARAGVFNKAIEAIKEAKRRGFRVTTNTTFFAQDDARSIRDVLDFLNDDVQVDAMQISPGYAYEKAPDQEHFLGVERTRALFRQAFAGGRRKKWRLNHSPLFLDFLEGKVDFACTAWGIPCYSVLGWQRPCYLMSDGYVNSYQELIETTEWKRYGRGKDERCANCMAHCGYEPSAVAATMRSPRESLRAAIDVLRGAWGSGMPSFPKR
jgi:hopanoid biosynthesis associated radical SAM protein HpnH